MSSRIRIKMGQIELEYEGPEEFLKGELQELLKVVSELHQSGAVERLPLIPPTPPTLTSPPSLQPPPGFTALSTSSIATKFDVRTGPKLIISAAAKLTFIDRKDAFKRKDLITEMRSAAAYFKSSYVDNLSSYLTGLVKDAQLNQLGEDSYALSASKRQELEKDIAVTK